MFNDYIKNLSNSSDYTSALTTILVLIFILIMYLVVFKVGVYGIGKFMDWKGDPYIFHGMIPVPLDEGSNATYDDYQHIFTNPMDQSNESENGKSVVILRSNNERGGVEFTWALWIFVDADKCMRQISQLSPPSGTACPGNERNENSAELAGRRLFHIFNKGNHIDGGITTEVKNNNTDVESGMAIMTCPGLYMRYNEETSSTSYMAELRRKELHKLAKSDNKYNILPDDNQLNEADKTRDILRNRFEYVITCNTMSDTNLMETVTVPNIPLNLWTHVVIRCVNHKMDVYINGRIKKRAVFSDLPRQNYGDLYICEKTDLGDNKSLKFHGRLSGFRYFNYALQGRTIEYFTEKGPSLKLEKVDPNKEDGTPYYLTQRWHYQDYMR